MDSLFKQVIVVRKDLNMRKGKMCAQVAHASNYYIFNLLDQLTTNINDNLETINDLRFVKLEQDILFKDLNYWRNESLHKKIVVGCDSEEELLRLIETAENINIPVFPVYDSGLTEFHGNKTLTCASFGPAAENEVDSITSHLKLL